MDLLHNPFHILGVSPVDDREKLQDEAEERSLFGDPEECAAALDALINPQERLAAEMSWFTKDDPKLMRRAFDILNNSSGSIEYQPDTPPLDRANIVASIILAAPKVSPETLVPFIKELGDYFDRIKESDLLLQINKNRTQSGFPMVSINSLQEEIQERRRWFRQVLKNAIDKLSQMDLVRAIALTVELSTDKGKKHAPLLVDDLLDSYELEAQPFLDREKEKIEKILEQLKQKAPRGWSEGKKIEKILLEELKPVLNNWNLLIKPIRTGMKARGLSHSASEQMCSKIRRVSIDIFNVQYRERETNEFDVLANMTIARLLNKMLREVFSDVPNLLGPLEKDVIDFIELEKDRSKCAWKGTLFCILGIAALVFFVYLTT